MGHPILGCRPRGALRREPGICRMSIKYQTPTVSTLKAGTAFRLSVVLCLLLLSLPAPRASAQIALRGTVLDARTQAPLPHATVQIRGSTQGTIANASGQFLISLPQVPATIEVRYIGYRSQVVDITSGDLTGITIRLEPSTLTLEELVITDDNPAEVIVRRAIQARDRMRKFLSASYADVYTRFLLYADFDLVQVNESVRASWWTPRTGPREVIRAERTEPRRNELFRFASPHPAPNFLDANIDIMGTRYAGPLHPDAVELYQFTQGITRELDGRRVMEIFFRPRSATLPAFTGSMAIMDSVWTVLEISARPWPGTDVLPPVKSHDLVMEQRFAAVHDSLWMPQGLIVQGVVEFGRAGVTYPQARYQQITGFSLHAANPPVPDSLARPGPPVVRDPLAAFNDDLFRRNPSYIPMTPLEAEQMATLNPAMSLRRAFRPEGILANYTAVDVADQQPDQDETPPRLARVQRVAGGDWFWYNRVDGWHPGAGYRWAADEQGEVEVSAGYSLERARPTYRVAGNVPWHMGPLKGSVGALALDATSIVARPDGLGRFVPGVSTYLGWDDLYDYYDLRKQRVSVDVDVSRINAILSVRFNNERHRSLEKRSGFNGWLFRNVQRENPSVEQGRLRSSEVGLRFGDRSRASVDISWERSPGWHLASDFDFTRIEARATVRARTFYRRRSRPNWLRVTVLGGTSRGNLPVQRQFGLSGSAGPFADFAVFRSLPNSRFLADELLGVFWAHDFTTAPFEKLGMWPLAERGWGIHVFGGHAFSSDPDLGTFGGLHHEIGVGLSYPFGLPLRMDLATGSAGGWYVKIGRPLR